MAIKALLKTWESEGHSPLSRREYCLRLTIHDLARLRALHEMYPARCEDDLLRELISAALDEIEGLLPYREGSQVVARDELGDPIFEDVGPSRQFYELTRKHLKTLQEEAGQN